MQKAKGCLGFTLQASPIAAHRIQQVKRADDVGLDEVARAVSGAVNMAFGREVDQGTGLVLCQQSGHQCTVANVALHENVAHITLQAGQGFGVACVGEFVEVDDMLLRTSQPVENEIGANETGAAGNKDQVKLPAIYIFSLLATNTSAACYPLDGKSDSLQIQALASSSTCPITAQVLSISAWVSVGCTKNISDVSPNSRAIGKRSAGRQPVLSNAFSR